MSIYDDTLDDIDGQAAAQTPKPQPTIYDQIVKEQQHGDEFQLRQATAAAGQTSPDRAAEAEKLAGQVGLPTSVVLRNFDSIKQRQALDTVPYEQMLKESPHTAAFVADPANPHRASIAQFDLGRLGALEWLMTVPQRAYAIGEASHTFASLWNKKISGPLTLEEEQQLKDAKATMDTHGALGAEKSWWRPLVVAGAEMIPDFFGASLAGAKFAAPAGAASAAGAAGISALAGAGFLDEVTVPVGTGAAFVGGARYGMTVGTARYLFPLESGRAFAELSDMRDEVGRPIDPDVARGAALAVGAVNAGLQSVGVEFLLKGIPGLNKLGGALTRDAMKQALRVPTIRRAIFETVKSYGTQLTEQTAIQLGARVTTLVAGELARHTGPAPVPGMTAPGNVDLYQQPRVANPDGSVSTVDSISVNLDGKEVLLPRVTPDGRHLTTPEETIAEYKATGRNLGTFDSPESATQFAKDIHEAYARGTFNRPGAHLSSDEFGRELAHTAVEALQGAALVSLPGPLFHLSIDTMHANRAADNVQFFQELGKGVADSETFQKSPAAAAAFVDRVVGKGPIQDVYAPVETWKQYWQSKDIDPAAMATELTGDPRAFEVAERTGEDLKIPTSRYATKLAGTEHNGFFSRELRLAPDEWNAREADAFRQHAEAIQTGAERLREASTPEGETAREKVRSAVLEQLIDGGKYEPRTAEPIAKLYAAAFGSIAERAGLDPLELYSRYGLNVKRANLETPARTGTPSEAPKSGPNQHEASPAAAGVSEPFPPSAGPTHGALPDVPVMGGGDKFEALRAELAKQGLVSREAPDVTTHGTAASFDEPLRPFSELTGGKLPEVPAPSNAAAELAAGIAELDPATHKRAFRERLAEVRRRQDEALQAGRDSATVSTREETNPEGAHAGAGGRAPQAGPGLSATGAEPVGVDAGGHGNAGGERGGAGQGRSVEIPPKYADEFDKLLSDARAQGFVGSDDSLAEVYNERLREARNLARDLNETEDESAGSWRELLKAVSAAGGIGVDAETAMSGEVAHMLESLFKGSGKVKKQRGKGAIKGARIGQNVPRAGGGLPGIPGIIRGKGRGGLSLDHVLEALHEDPRFEHIASISDLLEQINHAVQIGTGQREESGGGQWTVQGLLENPIGVRAGSDWWTAVDADLTDAATLEAGDLGAATLDDAGDSSFDVTQFDQKLFDLEHNDPDAPVDILSTGEAQPRLPGDVGAVRDLEVAHPEIAGLPFALETEHADGGRPGQQATLFGEPVAPAKPARTKARNTEGQTTLFQSAPLEARHVEEFAEYLRTAVGADLKKLDLQLTPEGDIRLGSIVVDRGAQRAGLGSTILREITRFADKNGARITLTPASKGFENTSSRARLVDFYKRFGFVENTGRHIDFALSDDMYREPTIDARVLAQADRPVDTEAFRTWFGKSQVVDEAGAPETVYHGTTASFHTFDQERGNIESDFGRGFYFTNNPNDVEANYAGIGPDLKNKIERMAERLASERNLEYNDPAIVKEATDHYVHHEGETLPVYLRLENPAKLGGEGETILSMEEPRDEAGDPDGEPAGTLIDFVQALREAAGAFESSDVDEAIGKILEEAGYSEISLAHAIEIARADEKFGYATDDNGDLASSEILRQAVEALGFDGIIDRTVNDKFGTARKTGQQMSGMDEDTVHYIAFDPSQIKSATKNAGTFDRESANIYEQRDKGKRGAIRFGPDRQMHIDLYETANLSTFLHETGHLFLEVMGDVVDSLKLQDPATLTEKQGGLIRDYQAILTSFGVLERGDIADAHHEQFARGFEAYLMAGKSPSVELGSAFARFRSWLVGVYQSVKALRVNVTPEVRRVLDRLVATDNAIHEQEQLGRVEPMFASAADAGMDPATFALYGKQVEHASRTAREQLEQKLMAEVTREHTAQWKAARRQVQDAVTAEVHDRPVFRALAAIRRGVQPDGSPLLEGLEEKVNLKMSRKLVAERFGDGRLERLPAGLMTRDGGMDPDVLADMFGFSSGDEMLGALEGAGNMKDVIQHETETRMMREHGSILLDGTLAEKARGAIANEFREDVIKTELRALARKQREARPFVQHGEATERAQREYERRWFEAESKLRIAIAEGYKQVEIDRLAADVADLKRAAKEGPAIINAAIPNDEVLRQAASDRIAGLRVFEITPQVFWAASRRAAKEAVAAAAVQDWDQAIVSQQRQLLSLHMFRMAQDAREDVDARVAKVRDLNKPAARARLGKAGGTYLEQIDALLERYNFAPISRKEVKRRASLVDWVEGLKGQGLPVDLPPELLNEALRVPFTDLTYDEFLGVTDGIQQIVHLSRLKNRLLKDRAKRELTDVATMLGQSIRDHFTGVAPVVSRDRSVGETARRLDTFIASHARLSDFFREMDGGQDGGPMQTEFMFRLNEAGAAEASRVQAITTRLAELFETAYPLSEKSKLYDKEHIASIGKSFSKLERLIFAANWGNEGNRDRVRMYEAWSDAQVQSIIDTLSPADVKLVQGILDTVNSFKDEIVAKETRVYGVAPKMVEATPITTPAGEIPGGYYPLKYDDRLSPSAAAKLEAGQLQQLAAYARNTTARGHLKERVNNVKEPIRLDIGPLTAHLQQVIHDLTHHEALIDIGRLFGHPEVRNAIYETYGDVVYKEIKGALRDVAVGIAPPANGAEAALGFLRGGSVISMLGFSLQTPLLHLSGALPKGLVRLGGTEGGLAGAKWMARGVARWFRGPETQERTAAWINANSKVMETRHRTWQRELTEIRGLVGADTGKFSGWVADVIDKTSFGTLDKQSIVDGYFYLVSKSQQVADYVVFLGQYEKSRAAGETHERAVQIADESVLSSQGGGQVKDMPAVMRGGPYLKVWTTFYGPFNSAFNMLRSSTRGTRWTNPASVGRFAADFLILSTMPAIMGYGIRRAMHPGGDDKHKDSAVSIASDLGKAQASYLADMMVGTRELSGFLEGYQGYEGPAGAGVFSELGKLYAQGAHAVTKTIEGKPAQAFDAHFWDALNDAGGVLFHYPAAQLGRTVAGIQAIAEGRTKNPLAILFGVPLKKRKSGE